MGLTGLHLAAKEGFLEICLLLLSRGCDKDIRDKFGNNCAYWAKRNKHNDLLPFLPPPAFISNIEFKEYKESVNENVLFKDLDPKKKKK